MGCQANKSQRSWFTKRERARRWLRSAGQSFWALVDQGALSLGGFLTNIILARTLSAAEYGLFSVIFGALLFLNGLHGAIIAYPLSVKGASGSHVALGRLAGLALLLSLVCALPACAGILGVAWMAGVLRPGRRAG